MKKNNHNITVCTYPWNIESAYLVEDETRHALVLSGTNVIRIADASKFIKDPSITSKDEALEEIKRMRFQNVLVKDVYERLINGDWGVFLDALGALAS